MSNLVLNKKQTRALTTSIYGDIREHCEKNFDRFFACYLQERNNANGKAIEPITVKFYPYSYVSDINSENTTGVKTRGCIHND